MSKIALIARTVFVVFALAIADSASALSPMFVADEFEMAFTKGSVALDSIQREQLANRLHKIMATEWLCTNAFGVIGYGDAGDSEGNRRLLALDRAVYIRDLARRLNLNGAQIDISSDSPEDKPKWGKVEIVFLSKVGPLGCNKPVSGRP